MGPAPITKTRSLGWTHSSKNAAMSCWLGTTDTGRPCSCTFCARVTELTPAMAFSGGGA